MLSFVASNHKNRSTWHSESVFSTHQAASRAWPKQPPAEPSAATQALLANPVFKHDSPDARTQFIEFVRAHCCSAQGRGRDVRPRSAPCREPHGTSRSAALGTKQAQPFRWHKKPERTQPDLWQKLNFKQRKKILGQTNFSSHSLGLLKIEFIMPTAGRFNDHRGITCSACPQGISISSLH